MKYEKPEVVLSESALAAVQSGTTQKSFDPLDQSLNEPSDNAYEADE
jgi:hypothetical protein